MFKTYDSTEQAFFERDAKRYDTASSAWVSIKSGKSYDENEAAWVERLNRYMELTVTGAIYNRSGNRVHHAGAILHLEVVPTSATYYIRATASGLFTDPVITGVYTFGNSDIYTLAGEDYYSHDAVRWKVNGYRNGSKTATQTIASGNDYRQDTVTDEDFELTLAGTFDTLELECQIISYSSYAVYGTILTYIKYFAIDGEEYQGNETIIT